MECQYHANKESREQKAGHKRPGSPSYLLCGTMVDHRIRQAGRHLRQSPSLPLVPSAVSSEAQLMRTLGVLQACSKQHQATCQEQAASSIKLLQELLLVICRIQDRPNRVQLDMGTNSSLHGFSGRCHAMCKEHLI